jgi:hypothetical protein
LPRHSEPISAGEGKTGRIVNIDHIYPGLQKHADWRFLLEEVCGGNVLVGKRQCQIS